jgi:GH25 family lysozyme M1 (1,4-beta-N-acetylmuramidase)
MSYLYGIDISNNDGSVDMAKIANDGVICCYMKATEGLTFQDSYMEGFYTDAKAQGLKIGAYHFLTNTDGASQAENFYNKIKAYSWDMYPMMDIETNFEGLCDVITAFINKWKELSDMQLGVYTYTSFLDYISSLSNMIDNYPFWQADYGKSPFNLSDTFFTNRVAHQYSETGLVNGVNTNCDLNYFTEDILISQTTTISGTWKIDEKGWYFIYDTEQDGEKFPANKWAKLPKSNSDNTSAWFYFNPSGYMVTGWVNLGNYYYLDSKNGDMKIGWFKDNAGKWFYADENGVMQKGWIKYNNNWYYLQETKDNTHVQGEMRTGWINITGNDYLLDSSGVMYKDCQAYGYSFNSDGVATKL